jgi:hypothetical protein
MSETGLTTDGRLRRELSVAMRWLRSRMRSPSKVDVRARVVGRARPGPSGDDLLFRGVHLVDEDFSRRTLAYFGAVGCQFERCRFDGDRIEDASFGAGRKISYYAECSFDGARINSSIGGYARFERCSFRDVDIHELFSFAIEFVDCTFSGRLRKGVFNGTPLDKDVKVVRRRHNEFHGNDFSAMELRDVDFRTGIDLRQQRLPVGSQYVYVPDAEAALRRARAAIKTWSDPEWRRDGLRFVEMYEDDVRKGQRQLFIRPDSFYPIDGREVVDAFAALLRGDRESA